jgi:hypothetical protein
MLEVFLDICALANAPEVDTNPTALYGSIIIALLAHQANGAGIRRAREPERTLEAVGSMPWIMIEAPPSAYHGGMLALGKVTHSSGEDLPQHQFYCGIDLPARLM